MRSYSLGVTKKIALGYNYLMQLDQQIGSLYDYIHEYNPNYLILNDIYHYYNTQELIAFNIYSPINRQINIAALNCHQGILNNFHHTLYLNFTPKNDNSDILINIPKHSIHLQPLHETPVINLDTAPVTTVLINQLNGFTGEQKPFPEGYILLSEVYSNNGSIKSSDRQNIQKYVLGRIAAPATFYILNQISGNSNLNTFQWRYIDQAELDYGLHQYYSFLPATSTFVYQQFYNPSGANFKQRERIRGDNIKLNSIQDNSLWALGYALNHELYIRNNESYEDVIMDDTEKTETDVFENKAFPVYIINIPNTDNSRFISSPNGLQYRLG